jgi:hypothetical protein
MSSMNQYYVIQNFKSYLAARAFLCQDYQKCLVTTSSRKHSKSPLTGEFLAVSPLSGVTFADFSPDVRDHSNFSQNYFYYGALVQVRKLFSTYSVESYSLRP